MMQTTLSQTQPGQIFTQRDDANAVQYVRGEYSESMHAYLCREKANENVLFYAPGNAEIFI